MDRCRYEEGLDENMFIQIFKYSVAGVITAAADFGVFSLLSMFHMHFMLSNICSYSFAIFVNYWMSVNFVFHHKNGWSRKKEFTAFVLLSLTGLFVSTFFLWFFYDILYINIAAKDIADTGQIGKMASKTGATVIQLIYSFFAKKMLLGKQE